MLNNRRNDRPGFIYRSCEAIRCDISEIKKKVEEVNTSLSIRELLCDMLSVKREKSAAEWLYDLEALIGEAEQAQERLTFLREELSILESELEAAKCRIRI